MKQKTGLIFPPFFFLVNEIRRHPSANLSDGIEFLSSPTPRNFGFFRLNLARAIQSRRRSISYRSTEGARRWATHTPATPLCRWSLFEMDLKKKKIEQKRRIITKLDSFKKKKKEEKFWVDKREFL